MIHRDYRRGTTRNKKSDREREKRLRSPSERHGKAGAAAAIASSMARSIERIASATTAARASLSDALTTRCHSAPTSGSQIRPQLGEAMPDAAGDLIGRHVILASRIANAARGGEILVSPIVYEIAATRGDISFGEARKVALKGITAVQTVHVVDWR